MRLREPYCFFVDRSLGGRVIASALRDAGEVVSVHDEHFRADESDVAWLREVGKRGWVVLTKDARIRTNSLERDALLSSMVAAFMLGRGDLGGRQMAEAFVRALPRMKTALRRWSPPLIAAVSVDGGVSLLYADGDRLTKPRRVK